MAYIKYFTYKIKYIAYNITYIRRPLPELERASLQLQSPMPSNPASPEPSNPDTPRGIRASKHPSIQASLTAGIPYSIILKGTHFRAAGRHRLPRFWAQNPANLPKSMLPPAQERQIAHLGHPGYSSGAQVPPGPCSRHQR